MAQTEKKTKRIFKITLRCILGVFLAFFLVMEGSLLSQKIFMNSKAPTFLGYGSFVVATGSMESTISEGDLVITKKTNDYVVGDIITFVEVEGATPVTHRIVAYDAEKDIFWTKGDANETTDINTVKRDQIVGEVVFVVDNFGWLTTEGGWVYIVAIIAIFAGTVYLIKIKPDDKKLEEKNDKEEQQA